MPVDELLVSPQDSIRQVMLRIESNSKGIALVVKEDHRLIDTVTDGDIRRAILSGMQLDLPVSELLNFGAPKKRPRPLTAPADISDTKLLRIMNEHTLRHIPLVNTAGRVVGAALLSELIKEYEVPLKAVIMAGGYGTRLRPLTESLPKPMLKVGNRPLLELIIEKLRQAGIRQVNLATHYKEDIISRYFGNGEDFGVKIRYVKEDRPLGTAGALSRIEDLDSLLLVINGDILTSADFRLMANFHREHDADMTVAVRPSEFRIPYGVMETEGVMITRIREKPVVQHLINAGIYLLNPEMLQLIPVDQPHDMTDLIEQLIAKGHRVVGFPLKEYWLDIGRIDDYEKAKQDVKGGHVD